MEPLTVAECRKYLSAFQKSLFRFSNMSKQGTQVVHQMAATSWTSITSLSKAQKVAAIAIAFGGALVIFFGHQFRRKRSRGSVQSLRAAARIRARKLSMSRRESSVPGASSSATPAPAQESDIMGFNHYNWSELHRSTSIDKELAENTGIRLVDGTPLTPQQLGLMGMEALETVVGYWEDALNAYQSNQNGKHRFLTTSEEAEFTKMLESILESAYQLQYESEHMFIHEHSILNRQRHRLQELRHRGAAGSITVSLRGDGPIDLDQRSLATSHRRIQSISSFGDESFVSAQDTVADLRDFEDLNEILQSECDGTQGLYIEALRHLEKNGIPYRSIRTEFVGCANDTEYLAKLHCLRIAFSHLMEQTNTREWWIDSGRAVFCDLIVCAQKDPQDFVEAFDDLIDYLGQKQSLELMEEELQSRNVKCINFYDVALDYILMDSFEDLEAPPSSVTAVMKNGWLTNGFKETALHTAIWSVLKAKRRLLKNSHGFKAQFYNLSEILLPILAWGFFGPDEKLNDLMIYFKDQVLGFIRNLYSADHVRYTSVAEMSADIMKLAESTFKTTKDYLKSLDETTLVQQ